MASATRRLCAALALAAAALPALAQGAAKPMVLVSVPAQAFWVDRLWGEPGVGVPLIGPGQDPHSYDPSVSQARAFSRADIYFRTGLDFERKFIETLRRVKPGIRVVDLRDGVRLRRLEAHSHAPGQGAHESPDDPHIWLGPREALIQVAAMRDALAARYPERAERIRANHAAFEAEIRALDAELSASLAPIKGGAVVVYHPAFGYFLDSYGIRQLPVEISGREPSPRQLQAVIDQALKAGARVVWAQPEHADRAAAAVALAIGARVSKVEENAPDWLDHLRRLAKAALP